MYRQQTNWIFPSLCPLLVLNLKPQGVIHEAFQNAAFLCEEYYDTSPEIELKGYKPVFNFSIKLKKYVKQHIVLFN